MGRRLNVSTPTVINTELVPLDESFYLDVDGQMEQWYYDNTEQYAPNRKVTPLLLVPVISAFDKDTSTSYTPAFNTTQWFANEWNETQGKYVETEITNQVDSGSADYVIQGNNLLVKKNVSYSHAVTIRCVATYIDPRDSGVTYTVEDSVNLTTNRTADVVFPEVDIISPSGRAYNPLVDDENSQYDFKGVTTNNPVQPLNTDVRRYSIDVDGTEEILNSGEAVAPIMDIHYGDNPTMVDQEFMYRQTAGGTLVGESIDKAYIERIKGNTVAWNQFLKENKLVDMGLPSGTLWASCDIDITKEDKLCDTPFTYEKSFFSWGNVDGHNPISTSAFDYDWGGVNSAAPWYEGQVYGDTQGNTLTGNIPVGDTYDAARVNVGALWRMPTSAEFAELFANIKYINADGTEVDTTKTDKRVNVNGVMGLYLESSINGARLFFSCSGHGNGRTWSYRGSFGFYWSSTFSSARNARYLYFYSDGVIPQFNYSRCSGFALRPVITKSALIGDGKNGHKYALSSNNANITDITLTYGSGNEPTTVEQFEADYLGWFGKPLTYEPYDEGSLRPVLMQSVKTTGFNQWDEEWEEGVYNVSTGDRAGAYGYLRAKNDIKVLPNTQYYIYLNGSFLDVNCLYINSDGQVIGYRQGTSSNVFTTPSDCVALRMYFKYTSAATTYNHDICINISSPSKNGTYEPYEEKVQGFDVTAIKGKLNGAGNSVTIFPDGLKKVGNIQDEIFVEDGVVKAIKRVGSVDFGSLTGWRSNGEHVFIAYDAANKLKISSKTSFTNAFYNYWQQAWNGSRDKVFCISSIHLYISDFSYTDVDTFKSAIQGVMLYYELATPQTYVLDPITDFVWYGIENGQEVLADTLPWYVSGQGTDNLTVDAMYGENINVVLRCKMMDGGTLSPSKAYATLSWRTPDIEPFVQSENGGAVRSDTDEMTFDTIVNVNGDVLSDALKRKHLAFNWKIRKNNTSTEIDKGWGQRITIDASDLRNVKGSGSTLASTLVGNEVYLKGAYEEVTDNGEVVTYNGEKVYDRPVD